MSNFEPVSSAVNSLTSYFRKKKVEFKTSGERRSQVGLVFRYSNKKVLIVFFLCSVCKPSSEMQIFLLLPLRANFLFAFERLCSLFSFVSLYRSILALT